MLQEKTAGLDRVHPADKDNVRPPGFACNIESVYCLVERNVEVGQQTVGSDKHGQM